MKRCRIAWTGSKPKAGELNRALVGRVVDAALERDDLSGRELCVLLVDDAESVRLHDEHFGDPTPTDVMSFPDGAPDPESGLVRIGDLAVGLEVARRVAAKRGRPVAEELALYVLHGTLHLLGFDDVDDADRVEMWAIQREIMGKQGIGIGPA